MFPRFRRFIFQGICLQALLLPALQAAEARLAQVFQDNMVLQRQQPVPVWGWGTAGQTISVSFGGHTVDGVVGADGRWQVRLPAMEANALGQDLRVRIGDAPELVRGNVLVGEVWIAAGQSNMNDPGPFTDTGFHPHFRSPAAPQPGIRLLVFGQGVAMEPQADVDPSGRKAQPWQEIGPLQADQNYGIPVYFATVLRNELQVPVGIIRVAVSGTNQTAWLSRETLASFPGEGEHANYFDQLFAEREAALAKSKLPFQSWEAFIAAEQEWQEKPTGQSPARRMSLNVLQYPTVLYNTRIHPLAPFAIRGVIWHQGEAGPGGPYGARMVAKVRQWRELFGQDFVFIAGTLSRHTSSQPPLEPQGAWFYRSSTNHQIHKARELFDGDPKVEVVELFDLGNHSTHFAQKAESGRRMALAALRLAHGGKKPFTGPRLLSVQIDGPAATLEFAEAGGGLVYRPSIAGISGLLIRDAANAYHWAEVEKAEGATLKLRHPQGAVIQGIAYGAAGNPHETLFSKEGLPASPFSREIGTLPWDGHLKGIKLVTQTGPAAQRGELNLAHVREEGYAFQLRKQPAPAGAVSTAEVWFPESWGGVEVQVEGKAVTPEIERREEGNFARFPLPLNVWAVVVKPGSAAEFLPINRF